MNGKEYKYPPIELLDAPAETDNTDVRNELRQTADRLTEALSCYGLPAVMSDIYRGPTVTVYSVDPEPGVSVSKIAAHTKDIALRMGVGSVRTAAPDPGRPSVVNIEIPNRTRSTVSLRSVIDSDEFRSSAGPLTVAVGCDPKGRHPLPLTVRS